MQINTRWHPLYDVNAGKQDVGYNIDYGARFLASLYRKYSGYDNAAFYAAKHYNGAGPAAETYAQDAMLKMQQQPWQAKLKTA
jgi:soluble lytic murein transglycosylase-like protein